MSEEGDYKTKQKRKICVKCYFNPESFKAVATDAEKAGKRRGGLQLYTLKPHGFEGQQLANTDGISKFLKSCWQYWREHESERLRQLAELAQQERELAERKRHLGAT